MIYNPIAGMRVKTTIELPPLRGHVDIPAGSLVMIVDVYDPGKKVDGSKMKELTCDCVVIGHVAWACRVQPRHLSMV